MNKLEKKIIEGKSCIYFNTFPTTEPIKIGNRFYRVLDVCEVDCEAVRDNYDMDYYKLAGYKNTKDFTSIFNTYFIYNNMIYVHFIAYQTTIGDYNNEIYY
jgi:hypothetical protein